MGESFPTIFFCLCCSVIVVPFTILLVYLISKSKKESWSGVITSKGYNLSEDTDGNTQHNYYLVVKMDDGTRDRNVAVSPGLYNQAKEGGKIKKDKGKLIPELI